MTQREKSQAFATVLAAVVTLALVATATVSMASAFSHATMLA